MASCNQPPQQETKGKAAEDPRMAGFKGKIAKKYEDSKEDWPVRPKAPAGAPNVLVILLVDTGFGQLAAYGGLIETPNMDKLAAGGLTYTNFHTTALCSPSRAAIMAGRNHHSIGLGSHALSAMGFPGYNGFVPPQAASGAKVLQQQGFTTYALGKWDHSPLWEVWSSGPFNGWASSEGFDHYYGFMTADIHNFAPIMYEDHWPTNPSPGAEFIAEATSPPVKNRSHTITASLETDGKTDGVITACGGYFSGYTLYVKNNIVTYAYNYYDEKYTRVQARKPLTAGNHETKLVYEKQGANTGKVTLLVDGEQTDQGTLDKVVLSKYSISEPFDVGGDNGGAVDRKSYTSPFKFSDTLNWVRFDLQ